MKKILVAVVSVLFSLSLMADEGMWLLPYLKTVNGKDMKSKGLKISPDDIYNFNKSSLKDAVIVFGGGCTGEIVSSQGLIFTNHHCGFSSIQALSSLEHDYLKNGYWAESQQGEIPVPGLSVRFVRHIEDVTDRILGNVPDISGETERRTIVSENAQALQQEYSELYPGMAITVRPMFGGNQYFLFVNEIYKDIRFVGAPPQSIGKFGGETDNWMWPRHTGDFSVFRVYAAPDGTSPAAYSPDNVPYQAPVHLTVSTKGYDEGDFSMIMGFPGSTDRYMTSYEIDQMLNYTNPNRVKIRTEYLGILRDRMASDDAIRIKYANKYASSANYWKNAIGMSEALVKLDVKGQKEAQQSSFLAWANNDALRAEKYAQALDLIRSSVETTSPIESEMQIYSETVLGCMDIVTIPSVVASLTDESTDEQKDKVIAALEKRYKDYDHETDKLVTIKMLELLGEMVDKDNLPEFYRTDILGRYQGDLKAYVDYLYAATQFSSRDRAVEFVRNFSKQKYDSDPATFIYSSSLERYLALNSAGQEAAEGYSTGHRLFIDGLQQMNPTAKVYPDANSTLRLTYGNIHPYDHADGVKYDYFTTLKGVIEKEDPENPTEFTVPDKLKQLYRSGDFGRYADKDGTLHVAFISNNDITGGNSGSPVLNAKGELIGLAFDGNWEALSGDIAFEPEFQRCINVDVRYVLFLIDKFGGAGWLLDEMTIK